MRRCSSSSTSTASSTAAPSPCPASRRVLAARAARGDDVVYVTNNSMLLPGRLRRRAWPRWAPRSALDRVVSSPRATALWLAEQVPRPRRVLAVGGAGLIRELEDCRVRGRRPRPTRRPPREADAASTASRRRAGRTRWSSASIRTFTYARLAVAADCVRAGARFVATNRDPIYPTERGLMPGAGSMVAAIEAAAGVGADLDRQARAAAPPRGGPSGRRATRATR